MLHSYAFSNFRSFLDRVEVPFTLTEKDTVIGWDRLSVQNQQRLTTAMAVLGANASGKTSPIQPLAFIAQSIVHSFNDPPAGGIPLIPHFKGRDIPSTFEVVADAPEADTLWRYRLSATMEHVVEESLESKIRRGGWRRIFERIRREDGKYLVTQTGFGLDQTQAENARPNVSLISWAAQFGVAIAQQIASLSFVSNMNIVGRNPYTSIQNAMQNSVQIFAKQPEMLERLRSFMANLGSWTFGYRISRELFVERKGKERKGVVCLRRPPRSTQRSSRAAVFVRIQRHKSSLCASCWFFHCTSERWSNRLRRN